MDYVNSIIDGALHNRQWVVRGKKTDAGGRLNKRTLEDLLQHLKRLRQCHGLSQEAFAEKAAISYKYYQAVEAGRKRDLSLSTLERLAAAYGLEVSELLTPELRKPGKPRRPATDSPRRSARS